MAGTPTLIRYDEGTRTLTLKFRDRDGVAGPTEIWPPPAGYPKSPAVTISDTAGTWRQSWDARTRLLSITTPRSTSDHTIIIRPGT